MNAYSESLESILDSLGAEASYGGRGTPLRVPSRQSSFQSQSTPVPASQGQVQNAARNLDGKIETLANGLKALETRVNTQGAELERTGAGLKKEVDERKKSVDGVKRDLQQTKMLSLLLPFLTQKTVGVTGPDGQPAKVVTQNDDTLSTILPFMLLMSPQGDSTGGSGGGFLGDQSSLLLFAVLLANRNK